MSRDALATVREKFPHGKGAGGGGGTRLGAGCGQEGTGRRLGAVLLEAQRRPPVGAGAAARGAGKGGGAAVPAGCSRGAGEASPELRSFCVPKLRRVPRRRPPGAGPLPPPRHWGLPRLPLPPSLRSPRLRSAAGTGASLCGIRAEPLPTLKPEPRALAALWRVGIKRLPGPPGERGRAGAHARGAAIPCLGRPCCRSVSRTPDGDVRQMGQFCPCLSSSSRLSADSREGRARGRHQGCCLRPCQRAPGRLLGLLCPLQPRAGEADKQGGY